NHFQAFCSYFFCFSANWLERWGIVFPSRGSSGVRGDKKAGLCTNMRNWGAKGVPVKTDGGLVPDLRRDWGRAAGVNVHKTSMEISNGRYRKKRQEYSREELHKNR
ncbi:MAG: hypothetical protein K0R59_4475, partial [Sphingobacterium sp.]|nr:hypothetical protein [Sphingobacterium sp.]